MPRRVTLRAPDIAGAELLIARQTPGSFAQHHEPTMWLYGLTLAPLLACVVHSAQIHEPLDCREPSESSGNIEACARPVDDIVAIVPGSSYIANVECKDCPYLKETWGADHEPLRVDQKLVR